jgi:hypothetical protein
MFFWLSSFVSGVLGKGYGVIPSSGAVSGAFFLCALFSDFLGGVLGRLPRLESKFRAAPNRVGAFDKQTKANGAGLLSAIKMGL